MRWLWSLLVVLTVYSCEEPAVGDNAPETTTISYNKEDVIQAVNELNRAMEENDTLELNMLLHDQLSYGHSNAWIQSRQDVIGDMNDSTLKYNKIDQPAVEVLINGAIATVRGDGKFDVNYKGEEHMVFDLHVMQTWVWEDGRWQLLNRQSTGIKK